MADNGHEGPSLTQRLDRLVNNLRPRRALEDTRPKLPTPSPGEVLASQVQSWVNERPCKDHFLPWLAERIDFVNSKVRELTASGEPSRAAFVTGYEAALRDLGTTFLAWADGYAHDAPLPSAK